MNLFIVGKSTHCSVLYKYLPDSHFAYYGVKYIKRFHVYSASTKDAIKSHLGVPFRVIFSQLLALLRSHLKMPGAGMNTLIKENKDHV